MKINLIGGTLVMLFMEMAITSALDVYWNIPSFMCKKHKLDFSNLPGEYGIRQNADDKFQGEKITILYDPGNFPALGTNGQRRNGGVPQEGSLQEHLVQYRKHIDELIPNTNNSGLIIIDFESWRPIFRQNWGVLSSYKEVSYQIEHERHPFWTKQRYETEAAKRFEAAGKEFVQKTIQLSRHLRPNAMWGYYAFPYCFNKGTNVECPNEVKKENDRMLWMYRESDMILPSVYLYENMKSQERQSMINGRIREAVRISNSNSRIPINVYIRYVYADSRKLLSESDLLMVFQAAKNQNANGVILWGSSFDLKTREKCDELREYLQTTMGPIAHSYSGKRYTVDLLHESLIR